MRKFWIFKLWPAYLFCSCPTQISWTKKQLLFFSPSMHGLHASRFYIWMQFYHENIHLPKGWQLGPKKRQQCPRLKEVGLAKREHEGYRNIIPNLGVCWRGSNSSIKLIRCFCCPTTSPTDEIFVDILLFASNSSMFDVFSRAKMC